MKSTMKWSSVSGAVLFCVAAMIMFAPVAKADTPAYCPIPNDPNVLIDILWPVVDINHDGGISLQEISLLYPIDSSIFGMVDSNHDGQVARSELIAILPLLQAVLGDDLLSFVDTNGDGVIFYAEVSEYVTQAQFAALDKNGNGVIECLDYTQPVPEGEPSEGETPEGEPSPEGEIVLEGSAEWCPLPDDDYTLVTLVIQAIDTNQDGGASKAEIRAAVPNVDEMLAEVVIGGSTFNLDSAFSLVDSNADGILTAMEIMPLLTAFTGGEFLSYVDANENGVVEYPEVSDYVTEAQFSMLDRNGNGVLDCLDVDPPAPEGESTEGEAVPEGEIGGCGLPGDVYSLLAIILPAVDTNRDGGISESEIRAVVPNADALIGSLCASTGLSSVIYDLHSAFALLDSNSDGVLMVSEVAPFLNAVADEDLLVYIDANGNRAIEYSEVSAYVTPSQFALLDLNADGVVNCLDMSSGPWEGEPQIEGEVGFCPLPGDAAQLIAFVLPAVDTNADGGLSQEEILTLIPNVNELLLTVGAAAGITGFDLDAVFAIVDTNRDGVLTLAEASSWIRVLWGGTNVLPFIDANDNGVIEFAEISAYATQAQFDQLDVNGNDVLDCGDLQQTPVEGEPEGDPSEGELPVYCPLPYDARLLVNAIWAKLDVNGDGGLSMEELTAFSPVWAQDIMSWYDVDSSNGLSFEETVDVAREALNEVGWEPLDENQDGGIQWGETQNYLLLSEEYFQLLDENGNGALECEDLVDVPVVPCPIPYDPALLIRWLWSFVDANADGQISLEEIQAVSPSVSADDFDMIDVFGRGALMAGDIDVYAQIFAAMNVIEFVDANADGLIQLVELGGYVSQDLFAQMDINSNAVLDCGDIQLPPDPPSTTDPCQYASLVDNVFLLLDRNNDGAVTPDELLPSNIMTAASIIVDPTQFPDAAPLFQAFDLDGNGRVTKEEVETVRARCDSGYEPPADPLPIAARLAEMFAIVDKDGNGFVTMPELAMYIQAPPEIFRQIDANADGKISLEELAAFLTGNDGGFTGDEPLIRLRRHVEGNGLYAPGETLTIIVTLEQTRSGVINALGLSETLPEGWSVAEVVQSAGAEAIPEPGDSGAIQFAWLAIPSFPARIVYRLNVPETASGIQIISGEALFRTVSSTELRSGVIETAVAQGRGAEWAHSADTDHNWSFSLTETLRVIQFFNSEGYHCADGTEDGYAPGISDLHLCVPSDCDYLTQDWKIDLSELLRMVQLFNAPGQSYYSADGTEDGFAPVLYKSN